MESWLPNLKLLNFFLWVRM